MKEIFCSRRVENIFLSKINKNKKYVYFRKAVFMLPIYFLLIPANTLYYIFFLNTVKTLM